MPRTTNADRILHEAGERVTKATIDHEAASVTLQRSAAVLMAHRENLAALEEALAPKPRKKPERSAPAQASPEKEVVPPGLCSHKYPEGSTCMAIADNAIHDMSFGYAGYHPFEPSKPVARARKRSSPKGSEASSTPTSETEKVTATAVGVSG